MTELELAKEILKYIINYALFINDGHLFQTAMKYYEIYPMDTK